MSRPKKKSGSKKPVLSRYEKILLTTAILNLIKALIDIIREFTN